MQCASPLGRDERYSFLLPLLGACAGSSGSAEASRVSLEMGTRVSVSGDLSAT